MTEHLIRVWNMSLEEWHCDCPLARNHDESDPEYQDWWKAQTNAKVWCPDCGAETMATAASIGDKWHCTVCGGSDF